MARHKINSAFHPSQPATTALRPRAPALASGVPVKGLSQNGTGGSTWGLVGTPDGLDYQNGGPSLIFFFCQVVSHRNHWLSLFQKLRGRKQRRKRKTEREEAGKPEPNHSLHPRSCLKLRHHGEGGGTSSFTNEILLSIINYPAVSWKSGTLGGGWENS